MTLIQNKFLKHKLIIFILILISAIVYFRWIFYSIFQNSDWWFFYKERLQEMIFPSLWNNVEFGLFNLLSWKIPLYLFYQALHEKGCLKLRLPGICLHAPMHFSMHMPLFFFQCLFDSFLLPYYHIISLFNLLNIPPFLQIP